MATPSDAEVLKLMAELNAEFGPKKKRTARPELDHERKEANKAFHARNPHIWKAEGKAPESRMNPEDSEHWKPVARVTHVVIQECKNCSDTIEYIGGEYIRFKAVTKFGGIVYRRADQCSSLFLMDRVDDPLEDCYEWHYQVVTKCSGCIKVIQHAEAVLWDEAVRKSLEELQPKLPPVVDITVPQPKLKPTSTNDEDDLVIPGL